MEPVCFSLTFVGPLTLQLASGDCSGIWTLLPKSCRSTEISYMSAVNPHLILTPVHAQAYSPQYDLLGGSHSPGPFAPLDLFAPDETAIRWSG